MEGVMAMDGKRWDPLAPLGMTPNDVTYKKASTKNTSVHA